MPKVIFTISYEIKPDTRSAYLALVSDMKSHFVAKGKTYSVYEQKGKKNSFVEIFHCASLEEFDALEDDQDEKTEALVQRLDGFLQSPKMKYTTLVEFDS